MNKLDIEEIYYLSSEFISRKQWHTHGLLQSCLARKDVLLALDIEYVSEFVINSLDGAFNGLRDNLFEEFKNQCLPDKLYDIIDSEIIKIKTAILESCLKNFQKSAVALFFTFEVVAFISVAREIKGVMQNVKSTPLVYQMH